MLIHRFFFLTMSNIVYLLLQHEINNCGQIYMAKYFNGKILFIIFTHCRNVILPSKTPLNCAHDFFFIMWL